MKWLVGLFFVWIILRGRFEQYAALASDGPEIQETGALKKLDRLMSIFE